MKKVETWSLLPLATLISACCLNQPRPPAETVSIDSVVRAVSVGYVSALSDICSGKKPFGDPYDLDHYGIKSATVTLTATADLTGGAGLTIGVVTPKASVELVNATSVVVVLAQHTQAQPASTLSEKIDSDVVRDSIKSAAKAIPTISKAAGADPRLPLDTLTSTIRFDVTRAASLEFSLGAIQFGPSISRSSTASQQLDLAFDYGVKWPCK